MAPSTSPHIASQLRQLIYYHLDNNLLKNALFFAGRLVAYEHRSPEAAYLLALTQYQSGLCKSAYDSSRTYATRGTHLGCAYIYAQACLELGRNVEGIAALERSRPLWQNRNTWNQHNESRRQHLPDAAAVLCLKGKLWKAHKNIDQAVECWAAALKLNPFMWDAFLGLCDTGAKISVPNIYKMSPEIVAIMQAAHRAENVSAILVDKSSSTSLPLQAQATNNANQPDPFTYHSKANGINPNYGSSVLWEKLNGSKVSVNTVSTILDEEGMDTSSAVVDMDDSLLQYGPVKTVREAPSAPIRKARNAQDIPTELNSVPPLKMRAVSIKSKTKAKVGSEDASVAQNPIPPAAPTKRTVSGQVIQSSASNANSIEPSRRSARLLNPSRPGSASATAAKISNFTSSLGLREGRDIKKAKAPIAKGRTATTATFARVVSGNRTKTGSTETIDADSKEPRHAINNTAPVPPLPHHKTRNESSINKDIEALTTLLDLMRRIASAQLALTNYDCQVAILTYNSLPSNQRETPYILSQIGKAYYEQASYAEAEKYFIRVRDTAPSRLDDMEVYSTVLWHLKNEIELAYLAHELTEIDRLSPQAWCAIGNSFSLQREHEQALKCFRRATQLDPQFAYGFTLQGHEYIANEEFDKALDAYRCAIAADGRHYNAWYGLGKVYEKMGKWDIAETHYRTAARINPTNAVLICCIGAVLEKLKQPEPALGMYTRACTLAPNSAPSRFKKARCLMGLGRPREALSELQVLKDVAPDEANVHFLLGRLYKTLRMRAEAVRSFTMALNLDPKARLKLFLRSWDISLTMICTGCAVYQGCDGEFG
jgi:anaphase-promoting complex subunit 3